MYNKVILISVCTLLAVCATTFAQIKKSSDIFSLVLPTELQERCGLHKLSQSELATLEELFMFFLRTNSIGESAVKYLKRKGWEEVYVVGTRRIRIDEWSDPEEYLIVEKGAWTYILEPRGFLSFQPGRYLGKMGLSSCEIIDSNGEVVWLWTKDQR